MKYTPDKNWWGVLLLLGSEDYVHKTFWFLKLNAIINLPVYFYYRPNGIERQFRLKCKKWVNNDNVMGQAQVV